MGRQTGDLMSDDAGNGASKRCLLITGLSKALTSTRDAKELHSAMCKIRRQTLIQYDVETIQHDIGCALPSASHGRLPATTSFKSVNQRLAPAATTIKPDIEAPYLLALYYGLAAMATPKGGG